MNTGFHLSKDSSCEEPLVNRPLASWNWWIYQWFLHPAFQHQSYRLVECKISMFILIKSIPWLGFSAQVISPMGIVL